MTTLNRQQPPAYHDIEKVEMKPAETARLDNGVPVYFVDGGSHELLRIELLFNAGSRFGERALLASAANSLLRDGTSRYSAKEIAEKVDYYGAFLETELSRDTASVVLYALNKHLDEILPLFRDVIFDASYPEEEVQIYRRNQHQKMLVNLEKEAYFARRMFGEKVFGEEHPYGRVAQPGHYQDLKRDDLRKFHQRHYKLGQAEIYLAGKVTKNVMQQLNTIFGIEPAERQTMEAEIPAYKGSLGLAYEDRPDALQSAIRVGRRTVNRSHEDFHGLQFLNTILGGYFGSRLMSNLREDKGYTYGVGSGLVSYDHTGAWVMATEVNADHTADAIDQIKLEMKRLREELVGQEEIDLVKNYMKGVLLKEIDGPFGLIQKFKNIHRHGLDYDYYIQWMQVINEMGSDGVMELANQYLVEDDFVTVVVGKRQ